MPAGNAGVEARFTSTCSFDQPSMLSDLILDICVPSLRWIDAHRMHRKMPNYDQLASCWYETGTEVSEIRFKY